MDPGALAGPGRSGASSAVVGTVADLAARGAASALAGPTVPGAARPADAGVSAHQDRPAGRPRTHGFAAAAAPARFVALGDSLSEGVGDRVAGGWRGWAALLAQGLGPSGEGVAFTNLAVSGAQSQDVLETQLPAALALRPHVASVVVGVNDTLRRTFDIGQLARRLDRVCRELVQGGAVVLTACLPDPGRMLGLPGPLARPLARRQRAVNAVVHALSERYDAVHLHLDGPRWTDDRALWSADRLHPGERGHRAVAGAFHRLLKQRGLALGPAPAPEPEQPPPTRTDAVLWLATAGTAWVVRRCGDLLPQLLGLAAAELRHSATGTGDLLDARAERALGRALRTMAGPATPAELRPAGRTPGDGRAPTPAPPPPRPEAPGTPRAEALR
ncbi:SGNH/GDSL hydrolase family protein [Streptomyces sp. NPDC051909]|uniref:SGNH/GDSL hydrolase family protein n=1 Tax=Streptomyces sp. NPDC051909 TaxID=3154944 RepID=UPI00341956E5